MEEDGKEGQEMMSLLLLNTVAVDSLSSLQDIMGDGLGLLGWLFLWCCH